MERQEVKHVTYVTPQLTLIGSASGVVMGAFIGFVDNKVGYASGRHNESLVSEW